MRILTSIILSLPLVGAYAIFAIGIVLIYRASQVLNLAHGAMAMVPAYVLFTLVHAGIPTLVAFVLALLSGAGLGLAVERLFVRRLQPQGPTAQTVGTVAALGILVALAARVWGTTPREAVRVFPQHILSVGSSGIHTGEIGLFVVMLVVSVALYMLLHRTDLGLMMRGTAESRLASSLHGVDPDRITALTWALGGGLAALAGILLAAVTNLNPYVLTLQALPGFIAALLGGLGSLPGSVIGAGAVGLTQGFVPMLGALGRTQGAPQVLLAAVAMVVMAARGRSLVMVQDVRSSLGGSISGTTMRRRPSRARWGLAVACVLVFPLVVPQSVVGSANLAASYSLVALSIVVLTGWVGQISLGHAALVGVGAYITGWITGGLGIPFPVSVIGASAAAGLAAILLGMVALRVRGLYLAVATLVFSWMASEFLFRQSWFTKHDQIRPHTVGGSGSFPSFDFTNQRVFFVVAWAFVASATYLVLNLRDLKVGRAFFAVRGSEAAAASLGIDVMKTKLLAFATSGVIAGAAGNLLMSDARVVSPDGLTFNASLFFLAIAVVGGLSSVGGAISSGVLFASLKEIFFRVPALGGMLEIVSALLLAVVLFVYSGGLASIPAGVRKMGSMAARRTGRVRSVFQLAVSPIWRVSPTVGPDVPGKWILRRLARRSVAIIHRFFSHRSRSAGGRRFPRMEPPIAFKPIERELSAVSHKGSTNEIALGNGRAHPASRVYRNPGSGDASSRAPGRPLVEAEGVTVRFGGLVAVDSASLEVREGEIVGLIGPNGAGKTTLFNAIAGFSTPADGAIRLYGQDVTGFPVHRRAQLGVARTFQIIQLFGSLTVFENLLVATHVHNPAGILANLWATERSLQEEKTARNRVKEVLSLLDLTTIAERRAADLPFGVLRMVEVARAVVTGFRVMMLDEPASGLDDRETDRLTDVLQFVRELGVSQLLIEHDVRMVMGVSDYTYVLDQGRMIAEGFPKQIQRNPQVVSAYLGQQAVEVGV